MLGYLQFLAEGGLILQHDRLNERIACVSGLDMDIPGLFQSSETVIDGQELPLVIEEKRTTIMNSQPQPSNNFDFFIITFLV
jgi:hypothetical protein